MRRIIIKLLKTSCKWIPKRFYLKIRFYLSFWKCLNLKNPQTLNEKIQWLKLYGYKPIHTTITDKYLARDYVAEKVGANYLVPVIGVYDRFDEIKFEELPDKYILKMNHGSGQNIIIRGVDDYDKKFIKNKCNLWLKQNYYHSTKEPQYKDITPKILIEKLLTDEGGVLPLDYKLHCINGKVEFIQVDIDRFENHKRNFYSKDWTLLPFVWCPSNSGWINGRPIERPINLNDMIRVAEILAIDFPYLRVDLYNLRGEILFGELTLHHGSGWEKFEPAGYDLIYGSKVSLDNQP
jgi:hypothetical protein